MWRFRTAFSPAHLINAFSPHLQRRSLANRNIMKLRERKMFEDVFPAVALTEIINLLNGAPQCVYAGFDPTADSLHVGNLLILINLLHWQRGGHQAIAVIGGATAKIGDPSGRSVERNEMAQDLIEQNIEGLRQNIGNIFANHGKHLWDEEPPKEVMILNNDDWYATMSPIDLIGGIGRHLRMGTLLSRASVESRLNSPNGMSFTEFSYQLFQSYDWLHLLRKFGCRFQLGGSDQMGNIMSGHDLIKRLHKEHVFGLTVPLITSEMGDKFGKSAGNAVWLSRTRTSPFTFYQFWMRLSDADAARMLALFTFDSLGAIKELKDRHEREPEQHVMQKRLARQMTLLVHGEAGVQEADTATRALYGSSVAALGDLSAHDIAQIFDGAATVELLPEGGDSVLDLSMKAGCFPTTNDAVRIIQSGGFHINQQKARNPSEILNPTVHRLKNNVSLLRVGKKNYYIVKWLG